MTTDNATRRYTDAERAQALATLASVKGNSERAAALLDIPARTLRAWAQSAADESRPEIIALRQQKRSELADRFESIAERCLGIVEEKLDELRPKDAMLTAAIAVDKAQLLRGGPTAIVQNTAADSERMAALRAVYDRVHQVTDAPNEPSVN